MPHLSFCSSPLPNKCNNILNGWLKNSCTQAPTRFFHISLLFMRTQGVWNRANNLALRKVGEGGNSSRYFQEDLFQSRVSAAAAEGSAGAWGGWCGNWCAEPRSRRAGVRLVHISPVSLFNYLKSKTSRLGVCENPVSRTAVCCSDILRGQPRLSANVRAGSWQGAISAGPRFLPFRRHCVEEGLVRNLRFLPVLPARTTLWQIGMIFFFF